MEKLENIRNLLDDFEEELKELREQLDEKGTQVSDFEDEIENLNLTISELEKENESLSKGPNVTDIVDWFSSAHVFNYDKRFVLEQFKHLLK